MCLVDVGELLSVNQIAIGLVEFYHCHLFGDASGSKT